MTGTAVSPSLLITLDDDSDEDPILDLSAIFQNTHPVELELGFGKGRFLVDWRGFLYLVPLSCYRSCYLEAINQSRLRTLSHDNFRLYRYRWSSWNVFIWPFIYLSFRQESS